MRHIEEHILELHVLGSEKVADRREEILAHLGECHGCRHLAEQMAEFYREAENELKNLSASEPLPDTSLARVHHDIQKLYEPSAPAIPLRTPTKMERFGIFVRRHPVVAGGGVVSFALAAALLFATITNFRMDTNPTELFLNYSTGTVHVYNKAGQSLWQKPTTDLTLYTDRDYINRQIRIADINGDGQNEVITTFSFWNSETVLEHPLSVINGKGEIVWSKTFIHSIKYANRQYGVEFRPGGVFVGKFVNDGETGIVVDAANDRSPSRIIKLDGKGNELGAYWHQGHLHVLLKTDLDGDGLEEIIAGGPNDVNDETMGEFPALVVLNPRAIVSQAKGTVCPDFELPFSTAEMYYVRFPIPDIQGVRRVLPGALSVRKYTDSTYAVAIVAKTDSAYGFDYVFDRSLRFLEVKSNNSVARFHAKMKSEGRITSTLDSAYLEALRKGVRYWDGENWKKEPKRVRQMLN